MRLEFNNLRKCAALAVLGLFAAGCGGGGGTRLVSASAPKALSLGTPASVTGSAPNGMTFTFFAALTTLSGAPAVTLTLHEANNGTAPVAVAAALDSTTNSVYPVMNVQIRDPQGRLLALPTYTGTQTLTLNPGDTADTSLMFGVSDFAQPGQYSATVSSSGTPDVVALTTPLVLNAQ